MGENRSRLVGHKGPANILRRAISKGRLGHANLLVGPNGIGRKLFAMEVAQGLLCHASGSGWQLAGCGSCRSCQLFAAGTHPDIRVFSKPEEDQEFKMALMEEVVQWFTMRPSLGERKATIIEDVDYLNEESANCFLKAAEEPPPGMWVAMLSENPEKLPATIRSRCQSLVFSRLSEAETMQVLTGLEGLDQQKAPRLARLSEGVPGRAMELADPDLWKVWDSLSGQILSSGFNPARWGDELKAWVEGAGPTGATQRPAARKIIFLVATLALDLLHKKLGIGESRSVETKGTNPGLVKGLDVGLIRQIHELAAQTDLRILRRGQIPLVLESFADQLSVVLHKAATGVGSGAFNF